MPVAKQLDNIFPNNRIMAEQPSTIGKIHFSLIKFISFKKKITQNLFLFDKSLYWTNIAYTLYTIEQNV